MAKVSGKSTPAISSGVCLPPAVCTAIPMNVSRGEKTFRPCACARHERSGEYGVDVSNVKRLPFIVESSKSIRPFPVRSSASTWATR
eukprot:5256063-Prymnesium_polylepis.1